MLPRLPTALTLMAICVAIHAAGVSWALQQLRSRPRRTLRFWTSTRLFVFVSGWIVLLHLTEISVWALFYLWRRAMPDLPSALYFSAVTYTTTGYGDLVLAEGWRLLAAVEALTGILMCGWSTGFFFAIVNRLYEVVPETAET
jgi:hypothetical protein